jgi:hypothetical protein
MQNLGGEKEHEMKNVIKECVKGKEGGERG